MLLFFPITNNWFEAGACIIGGGREGGRHTRRSPQTNPPQLSLNVTELTHMDRTWPQLQATGEGRDAECMRGGSTVYVAPPSSVRKTTRSEAVMPTSDGGQSSLDSNK